MVVLGRFMAPTPTNLSTYYGSAYRSGLGASSSTNANPRMGRTSPGPQLIETFMSAAGYPCQVYRLNNGHRVLFEKRPGPVASLQTLVDAGSIYEDPIMPNSPYGKTGFPAGSAHLDEHVHFLATKNLPGASQVVLAVEKNGVNKNASTWHETITHDFMQCRADNFAQSLALHADMVLNTIYTDTDVAKRIEKEKLTVINEGRYRSDFPHLKEHFKLNELMFHRPGVQVVGRPEDVMKTTPKDLKSFRDTFYTPDRMATVIIGDVDIPNTLALMESTFGQNPARSQGIPERTLMCTLQPGVIRSTTLYDPKLTTSRAVVGFPGPNRNNIRDRVIGDVVMQILAGGPNGWLNQRLMDRQNLIHQPVSVSIEPSKSTGMISLGIQTQPNQEKQVVTQMLDTLQWMNYNLVDAQVLNLAKQQLGTAYKQQGRSCSEQADILGKDFLYNSLDIHRQYLTELQRVDAASIQRFMTQYMNPQQYAVVYTRPDTNGAASRGGQP